MPGRPPEPQRAHLHGLPCLNCPGQSSPLEAGVTPALEMSPELKPALCRDDCLRITHIPFPDSSEPVTAQRMVCRDLEQTCMQQNCLGPIKYATCALQWQSRASQQKQVCGGSWSPLTFRRPLLWVWTKPSCSLCDHHLFPNTVLQDTLPSRTPNTQKKLPGQSTDQRSPWGCARQRKQWAHRNPEGSRRAAGGRV